MSSRGKTAEIARRRWNRTARHYDRMMALVERVWVRKWRRLLWSRVESSRVLEIGVGTGNNFPYYPRDAEITRASTNHFSTPCIPHSWGTLKIGGTSFDKLRTGPQAPRQRGFAPLNSPSVNDFEITAVDFSEEMLKHARSRASRHKVKVNLQQMDAQNLEFADNTFDTVVGTMVFCSIPDPVRGIREVERVCKPGGKVVLLEQDFSSNPFSRWLVKLANPLIARMGSDFRRRPLENVAKSGLKVERVTNLWAGMFKLIEARKV